MALRLLFRGPLTTSFSATPGNRITSFIRKIWFLLAVLVDVADSALWYSTGLPGLWLMPRQNIKLLLRLNTAESSQETLPYRCWFLSVLQILIPIGLVTYVLLLSVWIVAGLTELLGRALLPDKIAFMVSLNAGWWAIVFPNLWIESVSFPEILLSFKCDFFQFPAHTYGNGYLSGPNTIYLK